MATPVAKIAQAAAETVTKVAQAATTVLPPNFRLGGKKVYLPNHVITFVRPVRNTPPTWATFVVPLTFNKFDLRDYLWHVYNVRVTSVRSFVNQAAIQRKGPIERRGPAYRPQAQKMMMAELEQPFVWPEKVKAEDLPEEYDYKSWKDQQDYTKQYEYWGQVRNRGEIPLLTERDVEVDGRDRLRDEAKQLLEGKKEWASDVKLDERWDAILGQAKRK